MKFPLFFALTLVAASRLHAAVTDADLLRAFDPATPGLEFTLQAARADDLPAAQERYLEFRRTASKARWTVSPSDRPAQTVAKDDPVAEEILAHHIRNSYNFPPHAADMGKEFNWTFNPVSPSDPAFTHEWTWCAISRTQFWRPLAEAYWKTGDERYAAEWVAQMRDFVAKNPVTTANSNGATLWRTLDSAIRMLDSWPYAYYHFLNSPAFTPEANWTYLKSLCDHARLLEDGLKNQNRTGNWVATECFGLYTIGVTFPEVAKSAEWRRVALDRLTSELERMVPPDGFEVELTPNYHMVALDGFRGPARLAKLNNLPLPAKFHDKLFSMYRALVLVMTQNGDLVSTNDSSVVNARRVLSKSGDADGDPLLEWAASNGERGTPPPRSTALPYAGFYAMRSGWEKDDLFLFFRGGPAGTGHQHEDMLEVVLRAWDKTLLLDPGNHTYDKSDWRRYAIGTAAHNTIIVDGKWQHRGPSQAPVLQPTGNPWFTTPLFDYVAATYDGGYQKSVYVAKQYDPQRWEGELDKSVSHTRRVLYLRPSYALVLDTLDGQGEHTFDAHFHLDAPSAKLDPGTQAVVGDGDAARVALFPLEREHLVTDVVQGQTDPILGWKPEAREPIPTVRFRKHQSAPAVFATLLYPFKGEAPVVQDSDLPANVGGVWSHRLQTPLEKVELAITKDGVAKAFEFHSGLRGEVRTEAGGIILRQGIGQSKVSVAGWDLRSYRDAGVEWTLDAPGCVLMVEDQAGRYLMFNAGEKACSVRLTRPGIRTFELKSGVWIEISADAVHPVPAPPLFEAAQTGGPE